MGRHTKPVADLLTVARAVLGVCIAGLGWLRGRCALPTVVGAVIISWLTDLVDGPLARRDKTGRASWIGEHDAEADLAVSLGVAAYLVLAGYLAAWLGAGLVVVTLLLWGFHSHQLAWPSYAAPYALLIRAALREAPALGWVAVIYLIATLTVRWRRLAGEFVPQFFAALASLRLADHRDKRQGFGRKG
jgi:phosphatidylglycerophosphate synthase